MTNLPPFLYTRSLTWARSLRAGHTEQRARSGATFADTESNVAEESAVEEQSENIYKVLDMMGEEEQNEDNPLLDSAHNRERDDVEDEDNEKDWWIQDYLEMNTAFK